MWDTFVIVSVTQCESHTWLLKPVTQLIYFLADKKKSSLQHLSFTYCPNQSAFVLSKCVLSFMRLLSRQNSILL